MEIINNSIIGEKPTASLEDLEKTFKQYPYFYRLDRVNLRVNIILESQNMKDKYTNDHIIAPISFNEDDWYLYIVAAKHKNDDNYDVWTLNITTNSLDHGAYDVKRSELNRIIRSKQSDI